MIDFIDAHHGEGKIDWPLLRQNTKGAIVKCGDGYLMPKIPATKQSPPKDYTWHYDPRFAENWAGAKGMQVRGAYWYVRFDYDRRPWDKDATMERQALLFSDYVLENGLERDDVIVADIEQPGDQIDYLNRTVLRTRIKLFLNMVELNTGKRPLIYTYPSWWEKWVGVAGWELDYLLWIADYTPPVWIPKPWKTFWAHQYTDKGIIAGIQGRADLNRFGVDYRPPVVQKQRRPFRDILGRIFRRPV